MLLGVIDAKETRGVALDVVDDIDDCARAVKGSVREFVALG